MTTFHLMSDIHLEFLSEGTFSKRLRKDFYANTTKSSILILAGDVTPNLKQYRRFLNYVSAEYDYVIAIAGNHEFYGHNYYIQLEELKGLFATRHNTTFLHNEATSIQGVSFYGGICWTDLKTNFSQVENGMNDFQVISGVGLLPESPYARFNGDRWTVGEWRQEHSLFVQGLIRVQSSTDVVISHHVPDTALLAPKWAGSLLNSGYASEDMKTLLDTPKCWVFGHTHEPIDIVMQGTRFLCNPTGYFNIENEMYDNQLKVTL